MRSVRFIPSLAAALILFTASCQSPSGEEVTPEVDAQRPVWADTEFERALDAHGGLDSWRSFGTLEFEIGSGDAFERHIVDLRNRNVHVSGDGWTLGYDGRDMWVAPDLEAYSGNPMFYSSLHFYFFSLPFVLADPGTVHRPLGSQNIDGRIFDVYEVGFEDGVGGSSNDVYRMHLDPATGRLELLLYTATFYSGEPSERWGAREYAWQEVDGLIVPASYTPRAWNATDSTLGDARGTTTFNNVRFRSERPDSTLFAAPPVSEMYTPE